MIKIIRQALTLLLAVSLLASVPTAFAADLHQSPDDISLEQAISAIDGELKTSGTSIEQELLSLKKQYLANASSSSSNDEYSGWLNLANGVDTLIADYSRYETGVSPAANDPVNEAYLKTAVAAVVTWFTSKNYQLSAELLVTARNNTDENRTYVPSNQRIVQNSSVVRDLIDAGRPRGSGEFPASGNLDLYYSIHLFNYTRTTGRFTLTDVYDYEHGDESYGDSIAQVANDTMARAQAAGILFPYTVRVDVSIAN